MNSFNSKGLIQRSQELDGAFIDRNPGERRQVIQRMELDLSVAVAEGLAKVINWPFKSFYVESATDPEAFINIKPYTNEDLQGHFKVTLRDSWQNEYPVNPSYLFWPAQPGKKLTIIFFAEAKMTTGTTMSRSTGIISQTTGSSYAGKTVSVGPYAVLLLLAANPLRTTALIRADKRFAITDSLGTNSFRVEAGEIVKWTNTDDLYVTDDGTGQTVQFRVIEEFI